MKKITLLSSIIFTMLFVSFTGNAQVDLDCGATFVDSGDIAADYSSGETITYTICPTSGNPGDVVYVNFSAFSAENNGSGCWDGLTIYDGADDTATTIDPPAGGTIWCWDRDDTPAVGSGDLQGMTLVSTDPSGCLTFVFTSDGSVTRDGWEAAVTCGPPPTCVAAEGTAVVGTTDCGGAENFFIDVDVTSLGNATTVTISNDGGVASTDVTATGVVSVGPFASGSNVSISLEHDADPICNVDLPGVSFACPIANDECDTAIVLTVNSDSECGSVTFGTIDGATASSDDPTACGGTEDDDVWFSFVATATIHTIDLVNVANGTTDLYHSVWSGACGTLTNLTCSDPNNSTVNGLTIGETYLLRVYSWTATAGQTTTFDVCVGTPPPPPANDECDGAFVITASADDTCTNAVSGSTQDATASTAGCTGGKDVWFSFVAPADGDFIISETETFDSGFATTYISAYEGTCGTLTQIGDSTSCFNTNLLTITAVQGETYYISVRSSSTTAYTEFDLCIFTPQPPPANDACAGAIEVFDGSSVTGNTLFATNVEALTECAGGGGSTATGCAGGTGTINFGAGVWYVYTAGPNEAISVTTDNSVAPFDTEIQVFSGDCSNLTCVGGDDDGGDIASLSTFCWESSATDGTTVDYFIYVDGHAANSGEFTLDISVDSTLSIDDFDNQNTLTYFPNPVKNELTLNSQKDIQNVSVYNMLGQEVLRTAPNTTDSTINMNELSQGAYFVKVTIGNVVETIRVIKE